LSTIVRAVIAIFSCLADSVVVANWRIAGVGSFVTHGPGSTRVTTGLAGSILTGIGTGAKQSVVAIRGFRTLRLLWIEKIGNVIPVKGESTINGPV
jgi:hypothetical protein